MLTTALFLLLLYYLMRWYVPAQYYWVTIFLFMLRTDYGLLFINSNRQCWSLMFAILSVLVLLEKIKIPVRIPFVRKSYTKYVISIVLVYVGAQCHFIRIYSLLNITHLSLVSCIQRKMVVNASYYMQYILYW